MSEFKDSGATASVEERSLLVEKARLSGLSRCTFLVKANTHTPRAGKHILLAVERLAAASVFLELTVDCRAKESATHWSV